MQIVDFFVALCVLCSENNSTFDYDHLPDFPFPNHGNTPPNVKKLWNAKLFRYKPGVALGVPGG
jgi:hypothetical protein